MSYLVQQDANLFAMLAISLAKKLNNFKLFGEQFFWGWLMKKFGNIKGGISK